ncbi:zinc metalloproteinase nas-6-like [Mya arenaria]|uniref:zinc metalloproteinase nas-6-like n=1 Tax=Mya arenaria TaxID=6604 RepID=UPI0022E74B65|nr:zinc metalloproteinase nas-6-like [Mya arenaria]
MKILLLSALVGLSLSLPSPDQSQSGAAESLEESPNLYPEESSGRFEGDIDIFPGENPFHRNALRNRNLRWPNGVVPYEISSEYPSTVQNIMHAAMQEIETKTRVNGKTCIHFKPHAGETSYVKFVGGDGCHTHVGHVNRRADVTIGHGCERKGTIIHELLHSLGFHHEQSRPDRDNYVTIHYNNIKSGEEGNFKKYSTNEVDTLGQPYDYGSVLHYSAHAFAIDKSKPTIEPKQSGVTIGQRIGLSPIDIKEIQLLYDCVAPDHSGHTSDPHVSLAPTTDPSPSGSDVCTFQSGFCDWHNSQSDTMDWTRNKGTTPSTHTGPHADHSGSTSHYYIYLEASGHTHKAAYLDSKTYPGGDYCVKFYYHMHGANIETLRLYAVAGGTKHSLRSFTGDHGNTWHHQSINAHIHTTGTFHFQFSGHTGSAAKGDIAIDDIEIHSGNC